jgi:hypothetical protein
MRLLTASSAASSAATTARSILGSKTKLLYPNGAVYTQRRPSTFDTTAAAAAATATAATAADGVDGVTSNAVDVLRVEHDDSSLDDMLAGMFSMLHTYTMPSRVSVSMLYAMC